MTLYPKLITDALSQVKYPGTGKNIVESEMIADNMRIEGNKVAFSIVFPKEPDPFQKSVVKAAEAAIKTYASKEAEVSITIEYNKIEPIEKEDTHPYLKAKHIIAVSSGKGGVGKSTVTANLAIALAQAGYKVGLLDADIFGPSMPTMFHLEDYQLYGEMVDGKQLMIPAEQYGIKVLSIGFLVKPESAMVWRGPMASNALKQLIQNTLWGELDYFLIDTPPGTSDIHLTLMNELKLTGAIVVSTPQRVALADVRKSIDMYQNEKINIPIIGLIENMAWFTPAELPENKYYIFGKNGVLHMAELLNIPLLGQIPLVQSVCECGDMGVPAAMDATSIVGRAFAELVKKLVG